MTNYLMIVFLLLLGTIIGIAAIVIFINMLWFLENGEDN
jgi:hypothetical protein